MITFWHMNQNTFVNIGAKGEIDQSYLLQCLQRGICCRCVKNLSTWGKGFKSTLEFNLFPICRRILKHLHQATFENSFTNGEIAQDEQFLLLQHCFRLYLIRITLIYRINPYLLSRFLQTDPLRICFMWERVG